MAEVLDEDIPPVNVLNRLSALAQVPNAELAIALAQLPPKARATMYFLEGVLIDIIKKSDRSVPKENLSPHKTAKSLSKPRGGDFQRQENSNWQTAKRNSNCAQERPQSAGEDYSSSQQHTRGRHRASTTAGFQPNSSQFQHQLHYSPRVQQLHHPRVG